ncbi:MAG: class II fumarate hydratase [Chloroflexi bacterium]|nr:class II fumarate hydratase [Chloroflexota bacterium]
MSPDNPTRIEKDSMGPMEVPADAYYGASTERARLNFPISDLRFKRPFIRALGLLKGAAASVNAQLGLLDAEKSEAIEEAASEVADGRWDDEFVVDIFQTGSGTSTNMNANEVIANRATELMGGDRGSKLIHPNDHVNKGQSSNDIIPTTIHVAAVIEIQGTLIPALEMLEDSLRDKSKEFWRVIKTGRTHLQDATPIRLGQEFLGYAGQIERGIARAKHAQTQLSEVALGGTAVGTGVNTHPDFARLVCASLSETLGVQIRETDNHFQAQNALDSVLDASGSLRTIAVSLYKIANDVRWMGSGPRAGIGEIVLPEVQPGSSIMPAKINPVIAESVIQVVAQVIGCDVTICQAAQGGYFELNMMMPVAAHNLLQEIELLSTSATNFSRQCVSGLQSTKRASESVERGLMLATALAPAIGYDAAASVAKEAARTGQTIREVASEQTDLSAEQLDELLNAEAMTEPK